MNRHRLSIALIVGAFLSGCSGGGSSSSTPTATAPSISGDFLPQTASRGSNYQGNLFGSPVTLTMYNNPSSGGTNSTVLLVKTGANADATTGTKQAMASFAGSATTGIGPQNYVLYNSNGVAVANGVLPGGTQLVTGTLTLGQTFTPYTGMTAVVKTIGPVPGSSACPIPGNGAQVQYTFQGGIYLLSFVPGCGVTQYIGNNGETFTLSSVGSYPQLGILGDVTALSKSTVFDTISSIVRILVVGHGFSFWHVGR